MDRKLNTNSYNSTKYSRNCSTVVFDGLIGSSLGCSNLTASPAGKTSRILRCDWLSEFVRLGIKCFDRLGLLVFPTPNSCSVCNNINILLTKPFLSRWLDNGLDRIVFSFLQTQKRSYVIISSHLVSRLVSTPESVFAFLIVFPRALFSLGNENDEEIHSTKALMQSLYPGRKVHA